MTSAKKPSRFEDINYIKWSRRIKERDRFTCQICGIKGTSLHSHHINSWDIFINQRYSIANGAALCKRCHYFHHSLYNRGFNTQYQFEEFKILAKTIIEIVKADFMKDSKIT